MNKSNQEIEIKIKLGNAEQFEKLLGSLGATKTVDNLEKDVYYNNDFKFYESGKTLRLRKFYKGNLLTYKSEISKTDHVIKREEIQINVDDFSAMDLILKKLGFKEFLYKEKYSKHFTLEDYTIEIHKLPFLGSFVEIEHDEEKIKSILPRLELELSQGINKGYNSLFVEYCKQNNLTDVQMTFAEEKKFLGKM